MKVTASHLQVLVHVRCTSEYIMNYDVHNASKMTSFDTDTNHKLKYQTRHDI
jgi:hypothetical protein